MARRQWPRGDDNLACWRLARCVRPRQQSILALQRRVLRLYTPADGPAECAYSGVLHSSCSFRTPRLRAPDDHVSTFRLITLSTDTYHHHLHTIRRFDEPFAPIISLPIGPSSAQEIAGINNFTSRAVPASCATTVTPTCLQDLYGIPATPATQLSNDIAVAGFLQQFANQAELTTFLAALRPDMPSNTTFAFQSVDGGGEHAKPFSTW